MRSLKAYPGMAKPDMADSHVGHPEGEAETSNPMITTMSGSTPMTKPIPSAFFQPCQRTSEYQVMEGIIIEKTKYKKVAPSNGFEIETSISRAE